MARNRKTSTMLDTKGVPPMVHLPRLDPRRAKNAKRSTVTAPSNGTVDTQNKEPAATTAQEGPIVVNIPSSGRYPEATSTGTRSKKDELSISATKTKRAPVNGTSCKKSAKSFLNPKTQHRVKTHQPSSSAKFKGSFFNKPKRSRLDKPTSLHMTKDKAPHITFPVTSHCVTRPSPSSSRMNHSKTPRINARSQCQGGKIEPIVPQNRAMQQPHARYGSQEQYKEGAHQDLTTNNIYSSAISPHSGASAVEKISSSASWNDFAARTSGNSHNRTTSLSPQQHDMSASRNPNTAHRASPTANRSRPTAQRSNRSPAPRRWADWSSWQEVRVRIFGLTPNITTSDLWRCFSKQGTVISVELYEDSRGTRDGKGVVRLSPPPAKAFWETYSFPIQAHGTGVVYVRLEVEPPRNHDGTRSPVNNAVVYPSIMAMNVKSMDFGIMYDPKTMMSMHKVYSTASSNIQFRQSMRYKEIVFEMTLQIRDPEGPKQRRLDVGRNDRDEVIRFKVPFSQLEVIHNVPSDGDQVELLISLDTPPRFYRKVDEASTHDNGRHWREHDTWFRQTDIVYDHTRLSSVPLTLKKTKPIIDIGRWTTYRIVLDMSRNDRSLFARMCQALQDHNIDMKPFHDFRLVTDREPAVWDYIDEPLVAKHHTKHALEELIQDIVPYLSFPVRYQLEVCISQNILNEHNLSKDFISSLIRTEESRALDLLEYIAIQRKRVWDPMEIFALKVTKGLASRSSKPSYCEYIRSATITPSTVYYNTPTLDISNRVIRHFVEYADRFLRVRFTDEKSQAKINPTDKDTMNEVFTRVKRTMVNGITVGNRRYEFLAFGNSQFREHGAYFFAPLGKHITTNHIRAWMGDFRDNKTVAKYAARLGQCFSTTRAVNCTTAEPIEIDDVQRNGYTFSDGVGKISNMLARITASELGIVAPDPPSVFQFRLGGFKGVLAVSHDVVQRQIHVRYSQYKFHSNSVKLEIIRWSQMGVANLNRQLILVLSALGVTDDTFKGKLKSQLANLEEAMTDENVALGMLQKDIDPNQMTLSLAGMIIDGFQKTEEPFMTSLLHLWRAWSIKYLKEKARIVISDGALLLGCLDETATLRGHFNEADLNKAATMKDRIALLPEVFVQLSQGEDKKPQVITGPMLLARNPSLHPGDIRIVCGVDVPALRHLKDTVVLPQTGDRDIASMCSGGDLDGDDYMIMWDKDLLPLEWNHEPMDYTAPVAFELSRDITVDDLTSFFVTYMKNNNLPTIATAHLALADSSEDGVKSQKCLKLAELHSMAVDYVKTGMPARMTSDLRPKKWPHFMEKFHLPEDQQYHSDKTLGQLYDLVERVDFVPTFDKPVDQRILKAYKISPEMLRDAAEVKQLYDAALHRIMAQHDIKTEFEVWSTFVLHHSDDFRDYKFHEEIGHLSQSLKDQYRDECRKKVQGENFENMLQFVAAMYIVTAEEMDLALSECRQMVIVGDVEKPLRTMEASNMPLMSFPWLFPHYLGQIANKEQSVEETDFVLALEGRKKRTPSKKARSSNNERKDTLVETGEGTSHRGENLIILDDWVDVQPQVQEQKVAPKADSLLQSSTVHRAASGLASRDLLSFDDSSELISADQTPNEQIQPTSSSESVSSGRDLEGPMRPSQLFRDVEADIGTLSKVLTPSSSNTASFYGLDEIDGGAKWANQSFEYRPFPSSRDGSNNSPGVTKAEGSNGYNKENAQGPYSGQNDWESKPAYSYPTGKSNDGVEGEKEVEEIDDEESEVEEVEVQIDTKPSYIDRLSLLNMD